MPLEELLKFARWSGSEARKDLSGPFARLWNTCSEAMAWWFDHVDVLPQDRKACMQAFEEGWYGKWNVRSAAKKCCIKASAR